MATSVRLLERVAILQVSYLSYIARANSKDVFITNKK